MADCDIVYSGKKYSVNEFKTALLNGELRNLIDANKIDLPNARELFSPSKEMSLEERKTAIKNLTPEQKQEYIQQYLNGKGDEYLSNKKVKISDADISNSNLTDEKNIGDYVAKAKSVLETLYPNAKLEVYDTPKEYMRAGGDEGTRGFAILEKNGEHRILLNLEQIKEDKSGKTAFHEVIHPIVYDAFGVDKSKLVPIWNSIADAMQNVKGFEKVFEHIAFYDRDKVPQEGITELLTQIATGNIDLTDVPKSKANRIIDLVNKLFDALGINLKLNSVEDFHSIAGKIKEAFETGNAEDLKDVIKGKNIDKYISDYEKSLAEKELTSEQFTQKIRELRDLGFDDDEIKKGLQQRKLSDEKIKDILSQSKTEKNATKEGKQPEGNIPKYPNRESSGQAAETSGSNRPVSSGEKQQGQKEVGGKEPPPETPKTGEFSSLPQKERVRGAYQHLLNSDIPKDIKEKMEKDGISPKGTSIKYKVADNSESQKVGKAAIKSFGVDEALNLARQGTFHPSVNSSVFAEAINHFQDLEANAKTNAEKLDYAQRWADTYDEYAQQLTGAGQFSQYAYNYYKTSKLGFVLSAERKFNEKRDYFSGKKEGDLKELLKDLEKEPEFQEYIKGKVADEYFREDKNKKTVANKLRNTAKNIREKGISTVLPDWLKSDLPEGTEKATVGGKALDEVVATALETIAKGIEAGEAIADLVKDAVGNIKNAGAKGDEKQISDWLYNQFKEKKQVSKTTQEKILSKWDKKLSNLAPEKRKELLLKAIKEITDNGGLDLDTFKKMYADALGLPSLTPEMRGKLLELGGKLNNVDKATEALEKEPTQANIDAYIKAMQEGEKASTEINDLFGEKGITLDKFLNVAKLNTLGVANLVMNPLYNVNFMPIRFAESLIKTGLDYGLKYIGFARGADGVYENTFYKQFGYYGGFKEGLTKSIYGVLHGQSQFDYFKKSTRQNIRPLTSLKELISHYKGENPLTKAEVANAMLEAFPTMGASAAIISRALQVGDLPFRFAAERAMAESIAIQKGYDGVKKEAFILNPDEKSKALITDAGERAVMQQDNELTKLITRLSSAFKYGGGESKATKILSGVGKIIGATTQPFVKIPLNSAMSVLELAVPEFSAAKGVYYALQGNRDLALNAFSRMAVGIAIGAAYSQIANAGLITSTSTDRNKINASIEKEDVYGGNDLNFTGFLRWMSGGTSQYQNGDVFINLNALGVSGNIMAMYGAKYDKMPPDQWQQLGYLDGLANRMSSSFVDGLKNNVFSNTSTLIDAMSNGNAYSVNKWLRGSSNVLMNAFDPSWLSIASKLNNDFKVDYTAMPLKEQLASSFKERFWNKDELPKQITVWGEDRKMTPEGANPFLYYYADVTRARKLDSRDFGYNILSLYNKTRDDGVIPQRPQKTLRQGNKSYLLDSKQYEQLQILVGQNRKALTQAVMTNGDFQSRSDEEKVKILKNIYQSGYEIGKNQFLIKNPGFFENNKK